MKIRQPLLTLTLIALAFVTGYGIRKDRERGDEALVASRAAQPGYRAGSVEPRERESPATLTVARNAGTAPGAIDRQRAKVAELGRRVENKREDLGKLNRELDQESERPEGQIVLGAISSEISGAHAAIDALEARKRDVLRQASEQDVFSAARAEQERMDREIAVAQVGEQLREEQALSAELDRRVQELARLNITTDTLTQLKAQAASQADRVRQIQGQYIALRTEAAGNDALDRQQAALASREGDWKSEAAAIDQSIREQRQKLAKLEKDYQGAQKNQAAGRVSSDDLTGRFNAQRDELDALIAEYDAQEQMLAAMRSQVSPTESSPGPAVSPPSPSVDRSNTNP